MCGLFGIILSSTETVAIETKLRNFFNDAILAGDLRGGDGCGMMVITDKNTYVHKKAANAIEFRALPATTNLIKTAKAVAMLGHNRKSTMGVKSDENSHPFTYGSITLFHNGTLDYPARYKTKYAVDSESIADDLSQNITNPIKVLEEIEGAFSLVWYDNTDDTVNFARNKERSMYMATVGNGSLVYASEKGMIQWLLERNGVEINAITSTEVGKLISISLAPGELAKPVVKTFKPKESLTYLDYDYYYKGNTKVWTSNKFTARNSAYAAQKLADERIQNQVIVLEKDAETCPVVPRSSADMVCLYCGKDHGKFYMLEGEVLCESCSLELNYINLQPA